MSEKERKAKAAAAQRRYREEHPDRVRATKKAGYEKDKEVQKARSKAWYEANKSRAKASRRAHYLRNKEKVAEQTKAWREKNRERHLQGQRNARLVRKYGITIDDYEQMLKSQRGACAICKTEPEEGKHLHVDHCHTTQKVRGLLCGNCNKGLGHFRDDPQLFARAARYLRHC